MNETIIEMEEVAVAAAAAPDTVLVEGVNWVVSSGEYWVVGGMLATGKSSLLLTAAGLLRPRRGRHRLFGQDAAFWIEDDGVRERLRVGLVFADEGRLFNQLTVAENLALPICYHKNCLAAEVADRVQAVLEWTGLTSMAHRTPGQIHPTMRPRVGLARALISSPDLLLLDNPLRGMDWRQVGWWLEFLDGLRAGHALQGGRNTTLVAAADDLRPWVDHAERFAVLNDRRWIPLGDRAALRASHESWLRELLPEEAGKD